MKLSKIISKLLGNNKKDIKQETETTSEYVIPKIN